MSKPSDNPAATLAEIRSIMQRSTRFIALSGLSGVATGVIGLVGAGVVYYKLLSDYGSADVAYAFQVAGSGGADLFRFLLFFAVGLIAVGLAAAVYFTTRSARRQGQPVWDNAAKRLVANLAIPLLAGGIFCLLLFYHGAISLIMPAMLVFYGLAMLHASKYSRDELRNLGISEVALGLVAGFWPDNALLFWAIGFGLFPIIYGFMMYSRYERHAAPAPGKASR